MSQSNFDSEPKFEAALIEKLQTRGWEKDVLRYPTERELIQNWADILFENNRHRDHLGDYPLTDTEMQQIIDHINNLRTPLAINKFINGVETAIKRDNPDDREHYGKEVTVKIYDPQEIAAGQSRYQIVQLDVANQRYAGSAYRVKEIGHPCQSGNQPDREVCA